MFPISPAKRSLLGSTHYNVYVTCAAFRADGSAVTSGSTDLRSRFIRGSIRASMDDSSRYLTATFDLGLDSESLSPIVATADANQPSPGFAPGGSFQFGVAVVEPGVTATDGDYDLWDIARIDKWSISGNEITIEGRDLRSAKLLDRWIEEATAYGSVGGVAIETVMQQIIDDWALGMGVVNTPVSPGFLIASPQGGYAQEPMPVLEALRRLAIGTIGWDIRTFPSLSGEVPAGETVFLNVRRGGGGLGTTATFTPYTPPSGGIFMFYDPTRDNLEVDATVPPSEYVTISQLAVDDADVRNKIKVWYHDGAAFGEPTLFVEVEDEDSQDQYGLRFMAISEDLGSNIDTEAEATALAEAALADLKDPFATHQITLPLWPYVELNDIQQYPANDVHYDSAQTFAVVGYTHEFQGGTGTTTILARGRPIAAYRAYREGEPRNRFVALAEPPDDRTAPERALWVVTDNIDLP